MAESNGFSSAKGRKFLNIQESFQPGKENGSSHDRNNSLEETASMIPESDRTVRSTPKDSKLSLSNFHRTINITEDTSSIDSSQGEIIYTEIQPFSRSKTVAEQEETNSNISANSRSSAESSSIRGEIGGAISPNISKLTQPRTSTPKSRSESGVEVNPRRGTVGFSVGENEERSSSSSWRGELNTADIKAPIIGFELIEQRAKFTVFKLNVLVKNDSWFVFRRYTDFTQLQDKLKKLFPGLRFKLPPKRWFKDNYEKDFLEDRLLGLQTFVNSILCHKDVCNSEPVCEFFCFNDPPGPHDSLEESRAMCETLEEAVYNLKKELQEKDSEIELLKEELSLYRSQVEMLSNALREKTANSAKTTVDKSPSGSLAECDLLTQTGASQSEEMKDKQSQHSIDLKVSSPVKPKHR
ncbi:hypothetical protein CHS0354_034749 [Potamilus streckersoni]|uniref:PX domain-containing protein n=1 Tax=Potamilus streckersoni TaxID=2493646 RepID=A0AAE0RSW8_9BIVA|nr:hypothetical protein CHS0354_034749 [Potamilus streckersoni]